MGRPFDRETVEFTAGSVAQMSGLLRLRQLSFCNGIDDRYNAFRGPCEDPGFSLGMQLIKTFAQQLVVLELDYRVSVSRLNLPLLDTTPVSLPKLHTLRTRSLPKELEATLRHHCPSLSHVYHDDKFSSHVLVRDYIPGSISLLAARLPRPDELARFRQLETLVLDGTEDLVLEILESAPPSVRRLEISAFAIRDETDAAYVTKLFTRISGLEKLVIVDCTEDKVSGYDYAGIASVPVTIVQRSQYISSFPWDQLVLPYGTKLTSIVFSGIWGSASQRHVGEAF
ncbi:hypothetical protein AURDEDRAFT_167924 [Auricularia subglabra TFB-10046 SS5]|nr:hypothetical protein AURDEDRAFT_167924 [Auricularia subglabra TFB-10046 SS5]